MSLGLNKNFQTLPESYREPQQDFIQRINMINLYFRKIILVQEFKVDLRKARLEAGTSVRGYCCNLGESG